MVIGVKQRDFERGENLKRKRRENEREGEKNEGKAEALRNSLLDHNSSVEVGYGLCYFIVNF